MLGKIPLGRFGELDDLIGAAIFLVLRCFAPI